MIVLYLFSTDYCMFNALNSTLVIYHYGDFKYSLACAKTKLHV
jgi:hypothetical protein